MKRVLVATLPLLGCGRGGSCPTYSARYFVDTVDLGPDASCAQMCYVAMLGNQQPGYYISGCSATTFDMGIMAVDCTTSTACHTGRRPAEMVRADARARDVVGAWLANAAQLEAASVPAFEILAEELRAHDAPPSLIARALSSADDERRHAAIVSARARHFGAVVGPVRVVRREPRQLEAIARENAVEGLVREAYGAVVEIDRAIAVDEHRHAELARDVHAWIAPRLTIAARRRVDAARDEARATLLAECAVEPAPALRALGVPDATRAVELATRI